MLKSELNVNQASFEQISRFQLSLKVNNLYLKEYDDDLNTQVIKLLNTI